MPTPMSYGQVGNLTYLICNLGGLRLMFVTPPISLENWELGVKIVFLLDTQNNPKDVFIGEQTSGTITELESRDVNFLENEFPCIREVDKDF